MRLSPRPGALISKLHMLQAGTCWRFSICLWFSISAAGAVTCEDKTIPAMNPDWAYISDSKTGIVTDTRTGLMWKKCSEGQSWNGSSCAGSWGAFSWSAALSLGVKDRTGNYMDWRLPNIKELRSLVEECRVDPAINNALFPNSPSAYFWTSSPHVIYNSDNAWYVNFYDGFPAFENRVFKFSVRLVRGGRTIDSMTNSDENKSTP